MHCVVKMGQNRQSGGRILTINKPILAFGPQATIQNFEVCSSNIAEKQQTTDVKHNVLVTM